ncbi:MAG: DMT family transporter [Thermoplasmataceae archaeon]
MKNYEAPLLFLYMACAYALNYPFLKIAFGMEPPMVVLFFRIFFALISSIPYIILNLKRFPSGLRDNSIVFAVSMLNIVGFMGLWFVGESMVSAALSSILVYTYPIFNVLLSMAFTGERPGGGAKAGLIVGFAGVILVSIANVQIAGYAGIVLLLVSAVSWAGGTVLFKKMTPHMEVRSVNVLQYAYSMPILLIFALFTGYSGFTHLNLEFIGIGFYLGLFGTYLPYLVYLLLFRNYSISRISPYFFIVPALSVIFSMIILGETIGLTTIAGFAVISVGIFLSNR